ncbi:Cryptochrome/DNA photolyase FAD-binding [Gracilaria domingensis]|nr:Cryptochrome/DNA photolyase FAD-binding [Gracilaria domingensis]
MSAWMTVAPPPRPLPSPSRLQPLSTFVQSLGLDLLGFEISDDMASNLAKIWKAGSSQAKRQLDRFLNEVYPIFGESCCRQHFEGTSRLSPYICFGEISPRRMYHATKLRVSRWDQTTLPKGPKTGQALNVAPRQHHPTVSNKPGNNDRNKFGKPGNESVSNCQPSASDSLTQNSRRSGSDGRQGTSKDQIDQEDILVSGKLRVRRPHISQSARAFLKNLCLRDFSFHILYHFPEMNSKQLIPEFYKFPWAEDNGSFDCWRHGTTGYPIIDAAMRELRESGWIHNRMRFLLACFLTKYLLLPWSKGLRQFYRLLVDGDRSANALGWQWTAGSNTDAFPVTTLVNPVKQAYRQDPNGDYVRRWLPELAKLPTKYIHRPWKAPQELLEKCGIVIGDTYPERVVDRHYAMRRAVKAMTVMNQIFAANRVWKRRFREEEEKLVIEWPEAETEAVKDDELSNPSGKGYLLPSIWALGERASSCLQGSSRVGDSFMPMDTTACLVDGALPTPMVDQPESIEQALISAHEYVDTDPRMSTEVLLSPENRGVGAQRLPGGGNAEQSGELFASKSEEVEQIGEPLKYSVVEQNAFKDEEKTPGHYVEGFHRTESKAENGEPRPQPAASYAGNDMTSCDSTPDQELLTPRPTENSFPKVPNRPSSKGNPTAANKQIPEVQQFLNAQENDAFAQSTGSIRRGPFPSSSSDHTPPFSGSMFSQPINSFQGRKGMKDAQEKRQQTQEAGHQPQIRHEFVEVPFSSQHLQATETQLGKVSHSHFVTQQPFVTSMPLDLDPSYAARLSSAPLQVNRMPTVTMSPSPLVMGSVLNASDFGSSHVFGAGDGTNASQSHHVHAHQFYSVGQFAPMVNAHLMNPGERQNSIPQATAHSQKIAVPGMFPLT